MDENSSNNIDNVNPEVPDVVIEAVVHGSQEVSNNALQVEQGMEFWPEYCDPSYRMPEIINVKVEEPDGGHYFLPIKIDNALVEKKLYVGGYRNKSSGKVYHHAYTQTPKEPKKAKKINRNTATRETQTYVMRSLSVQPYRENGTQMERPDLVLDNSQDVVIASKPYFNSESLLLLKKQKTIIIQRIWRGYMARLRADQIRKRNVAFKKEIEDEKVKKEEELKKIAKETLARRIHPKSNSDFAKLYNELDDWRTQEIKKIKASVKGEEELRTALNEFLALETKALQSMQKLKIKAQKELHEEKTVKMMEEMSKPCRWQLSRGEIALVQTTETVRSKELLHLYNALHAQVNNVDERLEILLTLKTTVSEYPDDNLPRSIMDLVDREADLLQRGRPISHMENLRKRINNLYTLFIQSAEYNPRVNDFLKLPNV